MKFTSRMLMTATLAGSVLLLAGCANDSKNYNDFHDSMNAQTITVTTGKIKGASCVLANGAGRWHITGTPQEITLVRDYSDLHVRCKANGYLVGATTIRPQSFRFSLTYPHHINVRLHEQGS